MTDLSPVIPAVVLVCIGFIAGGMNSVVGSGSLLTFPVLIALGATPLAATLTGSVGLVISNLTGPWGYRSMLAEQRERLTNLLPIAVAGGLTGSLLLTLLPSSIFAAVAPALIVLAVCLVLAQPWLTRRISGGRPQPSRIPPFPTGRAGGVTRVAMFIACAYGGYFVAGQGVFMFGILGVLIGGDLRYINALKNAVASLVNIIAASVYVITAHDRIVWPWVAAIAIGSGIGGLIGARVGRRIPGRVLRWIIATAGLAGVAVLLWG